MLPSATAGGEQPRPGEGRGLGSAHGRRCHRGGSRPPPVWSPPPSSLRPAGGSSSSTRRARPTSAARHTGPSGGVPRRQTRAAPDGDPRTRSSWRGRTGRAAPGSTGLRTTGPAVGAGLRRLRGRRDALVAAPAGDAVVSRSSAGPSRGVGSASGHGNSVPRFHITWGTGPGVLEPLRAPRAGWDRRGSGPAALRHRVDELVVSGGAVRGVRGSVLAADAAGRGRGRPTSRRSSATSSSAPRGCRLSGGIGATTSWCGPTGQPSRHRARAHDHRASRHTSTAACSPSPRRPVGGSSNRTGCGTTSRASTTGNPSGRSMRSASFPGRARCGSTRSGNRLPAPLFPGFDTLGTLAHLRQTGHDHSWFILTHSIIGEEFALSGSEQNPDLTGRSVRGVLGRATAEMPEPVRAFLDRGEGLRAGGQHRRARRPDECPHPGTAPRRKRTSSADHRARPPARQTRSARTPRSPPSAGRGTTAATG